MVITERDDGAGQLVTDGEQIADSALSVESGFATIDGCRTPSSGALGVILVEGRPCWRPADQPTLTPTLGGAVVIVAETAGVRLAADRLPSESCRRGRIRLQRRAYRIGTLPRCRSASSSVWLVLSGQAACRTRMAQSFARWGALSSSGWCPGPGGLDGICAVE